MNETMICLVKWHGTASVKTSLVLSRNPCVITAHLTALLVQHPSAKITEETTKVTAISPNAWGSYLTTLNVNVELDASDNGGG